MSLPRIVHTLVTGSSTPVGYFDEENIQFIQQKISSVLKREYVQNILIDRASIIRVMERVNWERAEDVPKMNQRVVMYLTNEFRDHQRDVDKHLKWEAHYVESQRLYDPTVESVKYDQATVKLANRLGLPAVGGTSRFYFT